MTHALRPNDKQYLISMALFIVSFIVLTISSMAVMGGGIGFISCQPILYVCILFLIGSTVVYQSRQFTRVELVLWVVFNTIYLIAGLVFFIKEYEVSEFTIDISKKSEK